MRKITHESPGSKPQKKAPTPNPKRLDRTKYAGYLDVDPSSEYSGFFNAAHLPSTEKPAQT
ncbi:hypothetical protein [Acaryochloris thomasi]|uniref:hypothetical protein n=1 Tax=Acaryochloris thomasi TaxID=2929456 RepID=UPI001314940B|nr:hypothetical protein [Acaryochloris thomasi]